jgi:putative ABC transport system permease protein
MKIQQLVLKEIKHRKLNFSLSVFATLIATASLIGSILLLRVHDIRTESILQQKEAELQARMDRLQDDMRKAMLVLGFNIVILPKDQDLADWYSDDYSVKDMPESYVDRLANSDILSIRHLLPSLQQKILWPEQRRSIILVGTRGEVPRLHQTPRKPLVQPVPYGSITLGYELHRSMGIRVNDTVKLMGKTFTVNDCYEERGNKDDITAWINLKEAQELLGKEGRINAILALECLCTGKGSLPTIRKEIAAILPGTQVIERGSRALARAEARTKVAQEAATTLEEEKRGRETIRHEKERMASILIPAVLSACALWVAFMGFINVRSRREEIGILMTVGISARHIFMLFTWKHLSIGILGGFLGLVLGTILPFLFSGPDHALRAGAVGHLTFWLGLGALSLIGASFLSVVAGWIPAMIASRQDPAEVLRDE